jgi:hypothetical protein
MLERSGEREGWTGTSAHGRVCVGGYSGSCEEAIALRSLLGSGWY